MSESSIRSKIVQLVQTDQFKISDHALDALLDDDLGRPDVIDTIEAAETLEDYPDFGKGAAVLLFQSTPDGRIIHTVWGIPKDHDSPAVLITVYVPDPDRWDQSLKERK